MSWWLAQHNSFIKTCIRLITFIYDSLKKIIYVLTRDDLENTLKLSLLLFLKLVFICPGVTQGLSASVTGLLFFARKNWSQPRTFSTHPYA